MILSYKVSSSKKINNWNTDTIDEEKSMLFKAIECNNLNIIKLLLEHQFINADIGYTKIIQRNSPENNLKEQKKPLFLAVEKGNVEIVKLLNYYFLPKILLITMVF